MSKKICFLTCQDQTGYVIDDKLAISEMEKSGEYQVESVAWDLEADWKKYDLVIIRTTWDYVQRAKEFVQKLKVIAGLTRLVNSPEVVDWNVHKGYLKELEAKGITIVPTEMVTYPAPFTPPAHWSTDKFIIKPAVSATAYKTMIVNRSELNSEKVKSELFAGDWLLQPFLEEIDQGEISLHYFNKKFSHAIVKTPKPGDFRVQEEHGGDVQPIQPDQELLKLGQKIVEATPFELLYARVDLVKVKGEYQLMELELIEPALYFRTNADSPRNFKAALDKIFTTP